jgi:DNA repair protein RecN (Recombination protein N)
VIERLRIENVAIVERAELEFGPGLNVLTGETGAGKSIVLGALALLAGSRARPDAIREGCETAEVEAVFRTDGLAALEALLAARGLDPEDHELFVQRGVSRSGRGRARVSGQLVPVSVLSELFQGWIEISSQHDSQSLLRPETQGLLLDASGKLLEQRAEVERGFRHLRELDEALRDHRERAAERARLRDFLAHQVGEIDEARIDLRADGELAALRGRLAHAERLREQGGAARAALAGDDGDAPNAADLLASAARWLTGIAGLDPALAPLAQRAAALASEVRDAALDLERHLAGIDDEPARLAAVEERLHRLEQLQRKYGGSLEAVLRHRDASTAQLHEFDGADAREAELSRDCRLAAEGLAAAAGRLSDGRAAAARRLARGVQSRLRELAMPEARFSVALEPVAAPDGAPCGPSGAEVAEFRFSANAGEPLRSFRRVASGGELSRALLAIKGALREGDRGMVLVFDEVDAGVGGRAADRVGEALAELAQRHQVLCITHLPQIAAFAATHFRVEKAAAGGRTLARIEPVAGAARVEEIARMAGGERVEEATRRHARALLASRAPAVP